MDNDEKLNLERIAQALDSGRAGAVMKIATLRAEKYGDLPVEASEQIPVDEWTSFVRAVWDKERPSGPPIVARYVPAVADGYIAEARWDQGDPIIEAADEGLNRVTALHEIAHLICDVGGPTGHRWAFAREFVRLVESWVSSEAAASLRYEWVHALQYADSHPDWPTTK